LRAEQVGCEIGAEAAREGVEAVALCQCEYALLCPWFAVRALRSRMVRMIRVRLAPSTIAACSSSTGMPCRKPRSVQMVNGRTIAM
jgi:hypothetical protein